jgi:hypothetical protein
MTIQGRNHGVRLQIPHIERAVVAPAEHPTSPRKHPKSRRDLIPVQTSKFGKHEVWEDRSPFFGEGQQITKKYYKSQETSTKSFFF